MQRAALLEQRAMVDSLMTKYEEYLRQTILFDRAKSQHAITALAVTPIFSQISHAKAMKGFLTSFESTKQPLIDPPSPNKQGEVTSSAQDFTFQSTESQGRSDLESKVQFTAVTGEPAFGAFDPNDPPRNSFVAAQQAYKDNKDPLAALASYTKDCIPCLDRLKDLFDLDVGDELKAAFKTDLQERLNQLTKLLDILNSDEIYRDLCSLLQFLNFMCVTDLSGVMAALMALMNKILDSLRIDLNLALWSLLKGVLSISLGELEALLKKLWDMLLAPLECVLDAIAYQMQKIPGLEKETRAVREFRLTHISGQPATIQVRPGYDTVDQYGRPVSVPPSMEKPFNLSDVGDKIIGTSQPYDPVTIEQATHDPYGKSTFKAGLNPAPDIGLDNGVVGVLESSLGWLSFYLASAIKFINDRITSLTKWLSELIETDRSAIDGFMAIMENMQRLSRLIDIVDTLIKLAKLGGEFCQQGEALSANQLDTFFQNLFPVDALWRVVIADDGSGPGSIVLPPELAQDPETYRQLGQDPGRYLTRDRNPEPIDNTIPIPNKRFKPLNACIKVTSLGEAEQIQKWIADLMKFKPTY